MTKEIEDWQLASTDILVEPKYCATISTERDGIRVPPGETIVIKKSDIPLDFRSKYELNPKLFFKLVATETYFDLNEKVVYFRLTNLNKLRAFLLRPDFQLLTRLPSLSEDEVVNDETNIED